MAEHLRRSSSPRRLKEGMNVRDAFIKEGFSRYYLLALTNEIFEKITGYELEEGEYHIGDEIDVTTGPEEVSIDGFIVGFAVAKTAYAAELADMNLNFLNIVETAEGIQFGEIVGMKSDFYPVSIQEIRDIVE